MTSRALHFLSLCSVAISFVAVAGAETPSTLTLREAFAGKFRIGATVNRWYLSDPAHPALALAAREFDTITSANVMKWGVFNAEPGVMHFDQVQAFIDGRSVGLTPREFEVLHALARNPGKPVPRERLYREVWGYEMLPGDRSVDVFVRKVRRKLSELAGERSFIETHYGVGYRFEARHAE